MDLALTQISAEISIDFVGIRLRVRIGERERIRMR